MALPTDYAGGSIISNLIGAQIQSNVSTLTGKLLTRPALQKSDGKNLMYVANVAILPLYGQTYSSLTTAGNNTGNGQNGVPSGQQGITAGGQYPLYNVPLSTGDNRLVYAQVGTPVTLTRGASGQFTITGYAVEQPGSYILYPVNLSTFTTGTAQSVGLTTRVLTLGDLGDPTYGGGFGTVPMGAFGVYSGDTLLRVEA